MKGVRQSHDKEIPDFFLRDIPMTLETAQSYFLVKHYAEWSNVITLHPWDTWDKLGDRLGIRFGLHIWHPVHWDAYYATLSDIVATKEEAEPMPISERTELLTLCTQLHDVGIWLSLNDENALIMGPTALVKDHPDLLAAVRERKLDLVRLLEDCLVHDLYGTQTDDPRFTREECPECHQPCFIVTPPRRLGVHRLPGGTQVCPGSDRAQQATADTLMGAFIADRCVTQTQGILTWYSIRGALEAWCCERAFLLPPRPFLIAWLDQHYTRHGEDDKPIWQGLGLTLPEWGLEDTPTKEPSPAPTKAPRPKLVLTAIDVLPRLKSRDSSESVSSSLPGNR